MRLPRGQVSYSQELHYREAARWAHYQWHQFTQLDTDEQAGIIAHYEVIHRIDAINSHQASKKGSR
jgi:hypothetical protein